MLYRTMKSLLFIPLLLLLIVSCEPKKTPNRSEKQLLKLNIVDDPVSLDPRSVRSIKDLTLVKQLFEGLTRIDAEGIPQPALAEVVEVSDDLLTYTFKLRESTWSNGEPLTAQNFVDSWREVLTPTFASDYSYMLYPILNARRVREGKAPLEELGVYTRDSHTLIVHLALPTPYFLELTAFPTYFPVYAKNQANATFAKDFVCNGPFALKNWSYQSELTFEKNPFYWDKQAVQLDQIAFSIIADNQTESHLFEKNELHWLGPPLSSNISSETLKKAKLEKTVDSYSVAGTFWLKFNTEQPPFDQPMIRKALGLAINRREIIRHILQGNQVAATTPVPPSMALHENPHFKDGDSNYAKQLFQSALTENGWSKNEFPKIVLSYPPSVRITKIVQAIQQQWQEVLGVEVELLAVENHLYGRQTREGLFQVGTGEWIADFNDPLAFLELFKTRKDVKTGSGMNDTGWLNAHYVALLDACLTEISTRTRNQLLHEAEEILVGEMPIIPVYHYAFDYLKKDELEGVLLSPLGMADFKYAHFKKSQI